MIDTYAVMGNPINHSKSPIIHTEFARETQQSLRYVKIEVALDEFEQRVQTFLAEEGKGINITVPFKQRAFQLMTSCSERARIAKSVNTIKLQNGSLYGDNTDGVGLIRDLIIHHNYPLTGKNILIMGAGGAVRGILHPLLKEKPNNILLANRTLANAQKLVEEFAEFGNLQATDFDNLSGKFDLILNGTTLSLQMESIPFCPTIISERTFCYDLMYGQELTPFLKWAVSHGATQVADGLGMLVEQAAESFYIWRGVKPKTSSVIDMLKQDYLA